MTDTERLDKLERLVKKDGVDGVAICQFSSLFIQIVVQNTLEDDLAGPKDNLRDLIDALP